MLAKKEQTLRSSPTIRAVDHPQSSGEAPVPPRSCCLPRMPPPFNSTPPLCGLKWYLLHRDRPVIQTGEPAGCGEEGWTVATPAGPQLDSPPMGKILQRTSRLKAATLECLNSFKLAVIEVFHTFCLLLISCRTRLKGPFLNQNSNFHHRNCNTDSV